MKNDTSSRSHAICMITLKNDNITKSNTNSINKGTLFIVDLAGSEGKKDTLSHTKERIKEQVKINESLNNLKECIRNRTL